MLKANSNPFLPLAIGVCCLLLLPGLFMDGMFMDGLLYVSVSKNYAQGFGTFWEPFFSATVRPSFHEQPPLLFFLQGLFFKLLGFGMYTERIYNLLAALLNVWLMFRIWKIIHPSGRSGWVAALFWFTMPVTFYAFMNNLEECTMSVFVLATMLFFLRALHLKKNEWVNLLVAGLFILLAGMTKGVQGMFLLGAPFVWWISFRSSSFLQMVKQTFFIFIPLVLFSIYAWFTPAAHNSLATYFSMRFYNTFHHVYDTTGSRFHILFELLLDVLPLLSMVALLLMFGRKKMNLFAHWNRSKKGIIFFLLTATTGILPLMVTLEQRGFYLVTALPYIAIAAALLVAPIVEMLTENLVQRRQLANAFRIFGFFLIALAISATIFLAGTPKRDTEKINDLRLVATQTGERATLLTSTAISNDWSILTYGMRNHGLSFSEHPTISDHWLFLEKTDTAPEGYEPIPLSTQRYTLYKKR